MIWGGPNECRLVFFFLLFFFQDNETYSIKKTVEAAPPPSQGLPADIAVYKYPEFPCSLNPTFFVEPRRPEPLENQKAEMELKLHTAALTRRARLDKMQKKEQRYQLAPQFVKNKALRRDSKSDEDRSLMFDIILEEVWTKIDQFSIPTEEISKKSTGELEAAKKAMYDQQQVLISAADDEQLVEK